VILSLDSDFLTAGPGSVATLGLAAQDQAWAMLRSTHTHGRESRSSLSDAGVGNQGFAADAAKQLGGATGKAPPP
jgi:hypothetical protein